MDYKPGYISPGTNQGLVCPGGVMVRLLARDKKGRGFDSRPFHFQVTTLGKLFTHLCHQAAKQYNFGTSQGAMMPCGWEGNGRSNADPSAGFFFIRLAEQIFRLIFGLAEFLLQLQNAAENKAERYKFG